MYGRAHEFEPRLQSDYAAIVEHKWMQYLTSVQVTESLDCLQVQNMDDSQATYLCLVYHCNTRMSSQRRHSQICGAVVFSLVTIPPDHHFHSGHRLFISQHSSYSLLQLTPLLLKLSERTCHRVVTA